MNGAGTGDMGQRLGKVVKDLASRLSSAERRQLERYLGHPQNRRSRLFT